MMMMMAPVWCGRVTKHWRFDPGQGNYEKEDYHSIFERHVVPSGLSITEESNFQENKDLKYSFKLCLNNLE